MSNNEKNKEITELAMLMQKGFDFTCEYDLTTKRGPWGVFGKKTRHIKEKYTIAEPTLGTLDRMSGEFIKMELDSPDIANAEGLEKAKLIASRYAKEACRVVAIAVLGQKASQIKEFNGGYDQSVIDQKIDDLSNVFLHCIKPSQLAVLTNIIIGTANFADFCRSITLMSVSRTSKPNVIEEK